MEINQDKLNALLGRAVVDFGAALHAGLVVLGDKLGLYRALASHGPLTSTELAGHTGTSERYVREWACAQAAGGYLTYDPVADAFSMTSEQVMVLVDERSPAFFAGGFETAVATLKVLPALLDAFRTGQGISWDKQDRALLDGVERLLKPAYENFLVQRWIPALNGIQQRLENGGRVADIGCGNGASTLIMCRAFPKACFTGFDAHRESIRRATTLAEVEGLSNRVQFEVSASTGLSGGPYDLITSFGSLHRMGDPAGCAQRVWNRLARNGSWMIVEPFANNSLAANINPVGRAYYGVSTMVCTPNSLDEDVGLALGAQAGEARLRQVVLTGGFSRLQRVAETPFHLVLEAAK